MQLPVQCTRCKNHELRVVKTDEFAANIKRFLRKEYLQRYYNELFR